MKRVNTHQAKTQLSKLIAAARAGEEVVICSAGKPAIIHVKTDAEALTSRITLTELRNQALARQKLN